MSTSTIVMLAAATSLFALFASVLAWAQLQARRFTAVPIETVVEHRAKRRSL